MWTPSQRGVLVGFVLILSVYLIVRLARNSAYVSDPPPIPPARADQLADRIDPNVATWQELAVLPQMGEKRAQEIIGYREAHRAGAFKRAEDLTKVRGIGPAMLETLRPYLMFPATQPATRP